jgi:hypothetical protein
LNIASIDITKERCGDHQEIHDYACLYSSLNKVNIKDLAITFVESYYPREVLMHLQEVRGYMVEEKWPGIYIIRGDILPIQIIDNRKRNDFSVTDTEACPVKKEVKYYGGKIK